MMSVPLLLVALTGAGYLWLAIRERPRRGWSMARVVSFTTGIAVTAVALSLQFDAHADADFSVPMAQHLLLAMVAPLALVLGAPVTLLLRSLPTPGGRRLGRLLHSRPIQRVAHPVTALILSSGAMIAYYFTDLYQLTRPCMPSSTSTSWSPAHCSHG